MKITQRLCMMRLSAGLAAGVTACASEWMGPPASPPVDWHAFDVHPTMDAGRPGPTARERAAAETYVSSLDAPGFAALPTLLADDVHFLFPGMREARGREAVVGAHERLFGAFDSRRFVATRIWRTSTTQAVEWTMSATQSRAWMGVKPTGRGIRIRGVSLLWTRDDGTLADVHVYLDVAQMKAQLGAGPKGLPALAPPPPNADRPEVFDQTGSPDELAEVSLAHEALDALERKNEAAFLSTMSDDVQVSTPEHARPLRGKDDVRAYFRAIHKSIALLDTTVDSSWGISRFAVVEYSVSGEQVAPIGWVPTQHDAVLRLHVVDIIEVRERLLTSISRYENLEEVVAGE